jgi:hypothetical protein
MKQTQKLDALISRIIKEELEELTVPSKDGKLTGVVDAESKQKAQKELIKGKAVDFVDPTKMKEEEEMQEPDMEQKPKASEIAGQLAEIMEKLKSMAEGEDPKKGKHAAKVMKYMESAKAALEALTAHETMLEEKEKEAENRDGEKHLKAIEKHLGKLIKDKDAVGKIMKKMPVEKVVQMKKQAGKELDEEKLAKVMLKHSLKEGWVKKK